MTSTCSAIVTVTVTEPSLSLSDMYIITSAGTPVDLDVLRAVVDPLGRPAEIAEVAEVDPDHGAVTVEGGVLTFVPAPAFAGQTQFRVRIKTTDGST